MRYLKKPVAVEAAQWLGNNLEQVTKTFNNHPLLKFIVDPKKHNDLYIKDRDKVYYVKRGNWITYEEGTLYIINDSLFRSLYVVNDEKKRP